MIYFVVLFLLLLGVLFFDPKSKKGGSPYFWFCYLVLVLMFGLRYRVGGDTLNYIVKYKYIAPLSDLTLLDFLVLQMEPGFAALMAFFKQFTDDFYCVQLAESTFVNFIWFWIIDKNVSRRFLAISLYYVMFSFYFNTEIMREAIAVSLFVIAYRELLKNRIIRYYMILVIGITFHYSCFFMLLIPIMRRYITNEKRMWIVCVILFMLTLSVAPLLQYLGGYLLAKVERNASYSFSIYGMIGSFVKTILFPWIVGKLYLKYVDPSPKSEQRRLILIYITIGSLALGNFSILMRLTNYLQPLFLVLLVLVLERVVFGKFKQPFIAAVLCGFIWICYLNAYFKDESQTTPGARYYCIWHPYYSIFNEQEDVLRENFVQDQFEELSNKYD